MGPFPCLLTYLHSIKPNVWQSSLINLLFLTWDYQYSGTESVKGDPNPHVKLLLFMGGNPGGGGGGVWKVGIII